MRGPEHMGAFEFVVLASLRTTQLARGCTPKFPSPHKHTVTAQWEVLLGHVTRNLAAQTGVDERDPG
jgi:hypothetical protein